MKPATRERGEARYFHGRVKILDDFKELLGRAKAGNSGTSILIQAAPGAGKTALLHKCAQLAENTDWEAVRVNTRAFWDTDTMCQRLGNEWMPLLDEIATQGGFDKWIQIQGAAKFKLPGHTPQSIIERGNAPFLLLLDEAQTLGKQSDRTQEHRKLMQNFLNSIHNGYMGRPVILIAAGLGATAAAFDSLGISRFDPGCHINLGPLKPEAERKVIKDWLKLEGRAKGDPMPWIDAIARETHGWPQHIMAYVRPALKQLKSSGGEFTPEGLKEGRAGRIEFYEARTQGLFKKERQCIASAVAGTEPDGNLDKDTIITSLRKEFSKDEAEVIFKRALHKGVLDARGDSYVIPIPSMHDWLVSNYAPELKRTPKFNWYLVARITDSEINSHTNEGPYNEDPAILLPRLASDALKRLPSSISGREWIFNALDVDTKDVIFTVAGHNKTVGRSASPYDQRISTPTLGQLPDTDHGLER